MSGVRAEGTGKRRAKCALLFAPVHTNENRKNTLLSLSPFSFCGGIFHLLVRTFLGAGYFCSNHTRPLSSRRHHHRPCGRALSPNNPHRHGMTKLYDYILSFFPISANEIEWDDADVFDGE